MLRLWKAKKSYQVPHWHSFVAKDHVICKSNHYQSVLFCFFVVLIKGNIKFYYYLTCSAA